MLNQNGEHDIELIAGSGGVFEISIDQQLRYSKKQSGHFPTDDEILDLVGA